MRLYTGNYDNCKVGNLVSVSGDKGKKAGYQGAFLSILAPKKDWWQEWHDNVGKVPEDENIAFYVKKYYETVLSNPDVQATLALLPDETILLCYENPEDFCHRQIIAAFVELIYANPVKEVKVEEDGKIKIQKKNKYYADIKALLESLIKENVDMYGFECIAAAHAYECALGLEKSEDEELRAYAETCKALAQILEKEYHSKNQKM